MAPLAERRQEQAGPPVREMPRIRVTRPDSEAKRSGGGRRRRAAPAGTAESRESDSPDESAAMPEDDEADGVDEEVEPAAEGELRLEDTRHSGTEAAPGRTVRLRATKWRIR